VQRESATFPAIRSSRNRMFLAEVSNGGPFVPKKKRCVRQVRLPKGFAIFRGCQAKNAVLMLEQSKRSTRTLFNAYTGINRLTS
jgi:hypothetical protein